MWTSIITLIASAMQRKDFCQLVTVIRSSCGPLSATLHPLLKSRHYIVDSDSQTYSSLLLHIA